MDLYIFLQGMVWGLLITAPVGPVNVLCVQKTLTQGRIYGIVCGLGAATADTIYGAIAALGVACVQDFLLHYQTYFRVGGSVLVGYWGWRLFKTIPKLDSVQGGKGGLWSDYLSTFVVTLINPMTVVAFALIMTIFGKPQPGVLPTLVLIAGVFGGAQTWWCVLALSAHPFRDYCSHPSRLRRVNQIAGMVLVILAAVTLSLALWQKLSGGKVI